VRALVAEQYLTDDGRTRMTSAAAEAKPILCGVANPAKYVKSRDYLTITIITVSSLTVMGQRESSASIKSGPVAYKSTSPPTRQKILEMDCRGLEFVEFRPDVSF
jgi:hypothetical protein